MFDTFENRKIYFSKYYSLCYLETLICLIIFVNNFCSFDSLVISVVYQSMVFDTIVAIKTFDNRLLPSFRFQKTRYRKQISVLNIFKVLCAKGTNFSIFLFNLFACNHFLFRRKTRMKRQREAPRQDPPRPLAPKRDNPQPGGHEQ